MYHFYIFNYCTTTITSLTNNLFFSILSSSTCVPVAIADMKTPAQVRAIREEAWAPFHKCFDKEYQLQACSLVTRDATNKYFYTVDGLIVDPVRLERTVDSPLVYWHVLMPIHVLPMQMMCCKPILADLKVDAVWV